LVNGFFEFELCSVFNFLEIKIEVYIEVDAIVESDWVHLGTLGTRGGELAVTIPD
jgi:hypothetical protein